MSVEESFLRCTACEQDAEHEVVYAGRFVSQIRCTGCGREVMVPRAKIEKNIKKILRGEE